jgi:hypothetical protein
MAEIVIDSRFKLSAGEHSFVSENTSSDFVIQLPKPISQFALKKFEIPLSYYVVNQYYNTIIFRLPPPPPPWPFLHEYWIARIAPGTYDYLTIATAVQVALNSAKALVNETQAYGGVFVVTYDTFAKKLRITAPAGGIQFITTPSTSLPGIPLGDPNGFPSELVPNPTPDPIRSQLNNCAKILGLPMNSVLPDPMTTAYGFPLGQKFGFDVPAFLPYLIDLSGENYFYLKTDLVGVTGIRQAQKSTIGVNESNFTTIQEQTTDLGIIYRFQANQTQYSKIMGETATVSTSTSNVNQGVVKLQSPADVINFRFTFQGNVPINLNGVGVSFTIYGE